MQDKRKELHNVFKNGSRTHLDGSDSSPKARPIPHCEHVYDAISLDSFFQLTTVSVGIRRNADNFLFRGFYRNLCDEETKVSADRAEMGIQKVKVLSNMKRSSASYASINLRKQIQLRISS
jgi:hypothetical protein